MTATVYAAEIMTKPSGNVGFPGFPAELSCEIAVPMMDLELFGAKDNESMK